MGCQMIQAQLQLQQKPKLSRQQMEILDVLQRRRTVSNVTLNKICFNYKGRINELRNKGYKIPYAKTEKGGLAWYTIEEE